MEKPTIAQFIANPSSYGFKRVEMKDLAKGTGKARQVILAVYSAFVPDYGENTNAHKVLAKVVDLLGADMVLDKVKRSLVIDQQTIREEIAGEKPTIRRHEREKQLEFVAGKVLGATFRRTTTVTVTKEVFSYGGKQYDTVLEAAQAALGDEIPRNVVEKMFPAAFAQMEPQEETPAETETPETVSE